MTMCDTDRVMSPIRPTSPKPGAEEVLEFLGTEAGRKLVHSTLSRSHLSKNLADELGPHGIAVNCVHPKLTRTEKTADVVARIGDPVATTTTLP